MHNYICLARFTYTFEYAVLKLLLQREGLRFYFENETLVNIAPFYSNALGGIALKVHPEDVGVATQILTDFKNQSPLKKV